VGGEGTGDPEGHDRVDVQHRLELLVGHLVGDTVPGVAGVVDDDVHRAEGFVGGGHELLCGFRLGHVTGEDSGLTLDLGCGLLGGIGVEVVDQHLGAVCCKKLCGGPTDSPGGPGDDRALAVQKSH